MSAENEGGWEAAQEKLKSFLDQAGDKAKTPVRAAHLAYKLFRDPRVPRKAKIAAAAALGYWLLPFDLLPEAALPILGKAEDLFFVLRALRILLADTDRAVALEHWTGTEEELDSLRETLAGWDDKVRSALSDLVSWAFGERKHDGIVKGGGEG